MNWKDFRKEMPKKNELIWVIIIENRGNEYDHPCAKIMIAKADINRFGVPTIRRINHKGYETGELELFSIEYSYYAPSRYESYSNEEKEEELLEIGWRDYQDQLVAWMPFNKSDLPEWNPMTPEESKDYILNKTNWLEIRQHNLALQKANIHPNFIHLSDTFPQEDGLYVVANKNGVWLSRYEAKTCQPWYAPDGSKVAAWYPVPNSY